MSNQAVPTRQEIATMLVAFEDAKNRYDKLAIVKTVTRLSMALDALYLTLDAKVPEGFVLVPKEPTLEMCTAGQFGWESGPGFPTRYKRMLAAAQPVLED